METKGFNGHFIHKMSLNFRICVKNLPFETISGKFNRHLNNGCSRISAGVSVSQSGFSVGSRSAFVSADQCYGVLSKQNPLIKPSDSSFVLEVLSQQTRG